MSNCSNHCSKRPKAIYRVNLGRLYDRIGDKTDVLGWGWGGWGVVFLHPHKTNQRQKSLARLNRELFHLRKVISKRTLTNLLN